MFTRWLADGGEQGFPRRAALVTRFAALAALLVGAILTDIQVVRITLQPTAVEPVSVVPPQATRTRDAAPVGVRARARQ